MEEYKKLYVLIKNANSSNRMKFSDSEMVIYLSYETEEEARSSYQSISLFEWELVRNQLSLKCKQDSVQIYKDINDFRLRAKLNEHNEFDANLLILNLSGSPYFYKKDNGECYCDFEVENNFFLFSNAKYYFKLISFLKEQEHQENHSFYFVDYFNKDNRRIIITSSAKLGKLTIGYRKVIPDFQLSTSIGDNIDTFIEAFNHKQFPQFIKAELFNILPSCTDKEDRLAFFIDHLPSILERAGQNFEIYLSDLSLDSFKKQFLDFRIKYFNLFRDILSKLTTQVLAFPLSITAAAFASYKVIDNGYLAISIVVAYVVFGIYSLFMLGAYKQDIVENNNLFNREYDDISRNSFFIKYPSELEYFELTKRFIKERCYFLGNCMAIYSIVLSLTNSLFVFFVINQFVGIYYSMVISLLLFMCFLFLVKTQILNIKMFEI